MVGTDLLHAALLLGSPVRAISSTANRSISRDELRRLLVGSIPGVFAGSHLSFRVPERALLLAFAFVLVLSGIKLVKVPAANAIILVGLVAGALALTAWAVAMLRTRRLPAHDAA
jgi:uncharacterized membrane protein YfcA